MKTVLIDMRPTYRDPAGTGKDLTGIPRYARLLAEILPPHDPSRRYLAYAWRRQNVEGGLEVARSRLPGRVLATLTGTVGAGAPRWGLGPFDLFHGASFLPLRFRQACTVATIHDCIWLQMPDLYPPHVIEFFDRQVRTSLRFVDHVITVSEHAKASICEGYGVSPNRVSVAYPPVSRQLSRSAEATDVSSDGSGVKPFMLYVGEIAPRKNLQRVVAAFRLIAGHIEHDLVLAGPTAYNLPYAQALTQAVAESPLASRIHLLGPVTDAKLRWLYSRADVFVFPSLSEGFGLPLVEAMHWGKPVITSKVSAMPEVVADAAMLVDPLSIDAIAGAMETLAGDNRLRNDLQQRAVKRSSMFTAERFATTILDVYRKIGI